MEEGKYERMKRRGIEEQIHKKGKLTQKGQVTQIMTRMTE